MFLITQWRRRRLLNKPFPSPWQELLERVPLYKWVPEQDREELRGHILIFLAEKAFEGVEGLVVTDAMRMAVAVPACVLLLHRQSPSYYPGLSSIVLYPGEYVAPLVEVGEAGVVTEWMDRRSGEFTPEGAIVLSWEDVVAEGLDVHESYNVVLHEFAHQLDAEDGITAGSAGGLLCELAQRLRRERVRLKRDLRHDRPTVLDPYGIDSLTEMFAVATESFFERGALLRSFHPELYALLAAYYRQEPADWPLASIHP